MLISIGHGSLLTVCKRPDPQIAGCAYYVLVLIGSYALCQEVKWSANHHIKQIAASMREEVSWYLEELRDVVIFRVSCSRCSTFSQQVA